jgi:L-amino acid N-acyltransferase YncA
MLQCLHNQTLGVKIMNITIQPVFNSDANADKLRLMNKKFNETYKYTCKTQSMSRKEALATVKTDIVNGFVFFICADNKKIGYVLAPPCGRNGVMVARYLDTRFILPEYQGKGIGSKVLDILINEMQVVQTCLHLDQAESHRQYYIERGFKVMVHRGVLDKHFRYELENKEENPHVFLVHKNYELLDLMKKEIPYVDIITGEYINPLKEAA